MEQPLQSQKEDSGTSSFIRISKTAEVLQFGLQLLLLMLFNDYDKKHILGIYVE